MMMVEDCLDVAYKTEIEAKVVPHICPKIEDSEMVIDEELAHLNPMVSFCQLIVHISQNHIFTPTTTFTICLKTQRTQKKVSKVLLEGLINVTPLHWTHFGKDCPTSISSITTLISLSATGFMTSLNPCSWMGFIIVSGLPKLEVIDMKAEYFRNHVVS